MDIPPKIFLKQIIFKQFLRCYCSLKLSLNKLAYKLKNELDFFPAKLRIKNDEFKFFLGKIKLTAKLVDMEKSNFYEIDGEKFIDYPPVFLGNISGFEFCAKDINDDLIWAFSDKFKELVETNNLKMEFLPLT